MNRATTRNWNGPAFNAPTRGVWCRSSRTDLIPVVQDIRYDKRISDLVNRADKPYHFASEG